MNENAEHKRERTGELGDKPRPFAITLKLFVSPTDIQESRIDDGVGQESASQQGPFVDWC